MTGDATTSPEVSMIRREVPEFESTFQEELRDEDGEMGPFQAVSLLTDWVREKLRAAPDDDAVRRTFSVLESWITEERFQLGDALAAEFTEGMGEEPAAKALMGPRTRERARPTP